MYILRLIGVMGMVLANILTSSSQLPLCFPSRNKLCGTTGGARRYSITLDQQLEADFEWTSYSDLRIRECIPFEFLVNPNIWHVKVPLIVFATMEMHKSDRVMRQFGFRQTFLSSPQDIRALHKVDLWGRTDED
ncbi:hypothetical protein Goshw_014983 [Gossypium schwendimanii]|uniref:Aminotransferase-like plant mobile domain-containing protein n=1 Tax=Gossypium schwendimanii TaxID=34291 RepID=A0A7J9N7Q6_GOSSC|nr:hypothetical protein [Gossypium schwendimanii]